MRSSYQKFFQARESCNRNDIRTAEDEIEEAKDNLIDSGISLEKARELREKCEEIAKLRIERDNLHQERFESRQEIPTNRY